MEELLSFLTNVAAQAGIVLSKPCIDHLGTIVKSMTIKKNHYLLKPGEVCENLYFIREGLLMCSYYVDGKKVPDWFFSNREVVVSIGSFYYQKVGDDYIEALEDTKMFYISAAELDYVYKTFIEFYAIGHLLTLKYFLLWHTQLRAIRMRKAPQRYAYMLEHQPELIHRIPLKYLAAYLDMSRQTLNKILGK